MKIMRAIIALVCVLATLTAANALPITVDSVELDDITLSQSLVNRVAIERGEEYEIEVRFTALQNLDDVEVEATITGYDFSDIDAIEDHTPVFSADANVTYVKRLRLPFPDDLEEDAYKLRIRISDRDNPTTSLDYNIKVDVPRHAIKIQDVVLNPSGAVKAGSALLASVRVENKGDKDQNDVRVTVSIPELGISGTDYIDEIENGDEEEETEEIFLRIPRCTKAGTYDAMIEVWYNERRSKEAVTKPVSVLADESCDEMGTPKTSITLGSSVQTVLPGETATYPVTLTNTGRTSTTFTVAPQQAEWADVTISPTNTLIVERGQTKTVFVNVQVGEKTPAGAHTLVATVQAGEHTQELSMTAQVEEAQTQLAGFFETTLAVLLILLIIIGIAVGVSKMRDKTEYY